MPIFRDGTYYEDDGRPINCGLQPQRIGVTRATSGQVIVGVSGKKIRVYAIYMHALLATNVKFQSNATDITGTFPLAANGGAVLPEARTGWFETVAGEALNLSMSVATTVGTQVIYEYV